jgi:excisionase family DNA binding protein
MDDEMFAILGQPTCSVEQYGKIIGVSRNPAYEAVKRGDIPSIRIGGRIRIPTAPLKEMLGLTRSAREEGSTCCSLAWEPRND